MIQHTRCSPCRLKRIFNHKTKRTHRVYINSNYSYNNDNMIHKNTNSSHIICQTHVNTNLSAFNRRRHVRETIYHVTVATRFKQTHVRLASHRTDKYTEEIIKNIYKTDFKIQVDKFDHMKVVYLDVVRKGVKVISVMNCELEEIFSIDMVVGFIDTTHVKTLIPTPPTFPFYSLLLRSLYI